MDDLPMTPVDTGSAVAMWREYAATHPTIATDRDDPPVERFGDRLRTHRGFWRRTLAARGDQWHEDLEVVFERFAVVWPPSVADQ